MSEKLKSGMDPDAARRMFGNPWGLLGPVKSVLSWLFKTGKEMLDVAGESQARRDKEKADRIAKRLANKGKEWWRLFWLEKKK